VALNYDLQGPVRCKYYVLGLHDNYLIDGDAGKYIFRLYRNTWRTQEEALFELELLTFLGNKDAPVATPISTNQGQLSLLIESPEGDRVGALFRYADGHAPENEVTVKQSLLLGQTVANIHLLTQTYDSPCARPVLDIYYLLDESIIAIEPFIDTDARDYLKVLQRKLHHIVPGLRQEAGEFGICIGDVNLSNFHINDNNQITLFDFDQCGYGYRAFEIGKFLSSIHSLKSKQKIGQAFVDGYQLVRPLSQAELDIIPYFEIVAVIWVMAIHAYNAERIGHKFLEKPFWDRRLAVLKELDKVMPD